MPSSPAIAKNTNAVTMMRRPMTEWLTEARRCSPGPVAQIAASSRCSRSARPAFGAVRPARSLSRLPPGDVASAAGKSAAGCATTSNRIPACPTPQNSAQTPLVAPRRVGLDAQDVHAPRDRVDLAGEARDPERVNDVAARHHDVDGCAGGKMQDARGPLAAVVRILEGPAPLFRADLDPRRRLAAAAAGGVRRRRARRPPAARGRRPAARARRARASGAAAPTRPSPAAGTRPRTGPSPARRARSRRRASPTTAWRSPRPRARRVRASTAVRCSPRGPQPLPRLTAVRRTL